MVIQPFDLVNWKVRRGFFWCWSCLFGVIAASLKPKSPSLEQGKNSLSPGALLELPEVLE